MDAFARSRRAAGPTAARPLAAAVPGPPCDLGWPARRGAAPLRGDAPRLLADGASSSNGPTGWPTWRWSRSSPGNLDAAVELTDDAFVAAHDAGNRQAVAWHGYPAGLAYAHLGRTADAERFGAELRAWADAHDQPPRRLMAHHVLGIAALSRGAASAAARRARHRGRPRRSPRVPPPRLHPRPARRHRGPRASPVTKRRAGAWPANSTGKRQRSDSRGSTRPPVVDAAWPCWPRGIPPPLDELAAAVAAFDTLGYRLDAARTQILSAGHCAGAASGRPPRPRWTRAMPG